jgi:hypothetical protein
MAICHRFPYLRLAALYYNFVVALCTLKEIAYRESGNSHIHNVQKLPLFEIYPVKRRLSRTIAFRSCTEQPLNHAEV